MTGTSRSAERYSEQGEDNYSDSSDLEHLDSSARDLRKDFKNLNAKFNLFSYELKLLLAQIEIISTWIQEKFDTQLFAKESIALHHVSDYREIREIAGLLTTTVSVHDRGQNSPDEDAFVDTLQDSDRNISSESDSEIQQVTPVKKSAQKSHYLSPRKSPSGSVTKKSKFDDSFRALNLFVDPNPIDNNSSPKGQQREADISRKSPRKRGKSTSPSKPHEFTIRSGSFTEASVSPRNETSRKEKPIKSTRCNLANPVDNLEVADASESESLEQIRQNPAQAGSVGKSRISPKKTPQKKSPRKNLAAQFLSPPTANSNRVLVTLSPVHCPSKHSSPKSKSPSRVSPKKVSPRKSSVNVTEEDSTSSSSTIRNFNCDECGKTLATASNLREHKKIHRDIRPFKCDQCGRSFRRNQKLKLHLLIHQGEEGKQYQCGYCGKLFLQRRDLVRHERIHTGEKPYQCPNCPKSFSIKQHLTYHIRTHTGERPYKCDECEKSFSQPNTLRLHKKLHQGIKYVAPSRLKKRKAKLESKSRVAGGPTVVVTISPTKHSSAKATTQSNLRQFFVPTSESSLISNVSLNSLPVQEQGETASVSENYSET